MNIGLRTDPAAGFGKPTGAGHGVLMNLGVGLLTIMAAGFRSITAGIGGLDPAIHITVRSGRLPMFRLWVLAMAGRTGISDLASDTTRSAGCPWDPEIITIRGGDIGIPTGV